MKNLKLIGFLIAMASSLMFIQCTTDTVVGPAGADGTNGVNGINGINGVDGVDGVGTASCIECHSDTHRAPINDAYALSGHATGTSWARGKSGGCAQCHNNQGFIDYTSGQFLGSDGYPSANTAGYAVSEAITCSGCHSDHRSFDFDVDGNDYAVRTLAAVPLMIDRDYVIDIKNDSDPMGKSNTCVVCHQPRRNIADANDMDELFQSSGHWGPHHGPQGTFLEGLGGAEIAGSTPYEAPGSMRHRTGSSCVACHMGEDADGNPNPGGHEWLSNENTCLECHSSIKTVTNFDENVAALEALLEEAEGWEYRYSVVRDVDGAIVLDADGDIQFLDAAGNVLDKELDDVEDLYVIEEDLNGDPIKDVVVGIVHDGHAYLGSYGFGVNWPYETAQAAWNYILITQEDMSKGVHNPAYATALLQNSIEALQ